MTPSERIYLIKNICSSLSMEDWSLLDLTLRQFNFPTADTYQGDKFHYVISQIENGQDTDILNLANHLKIEMTLTESDLNPTFWREGYFKLFISHLSADKVKANSLKDLLESFAISGFVAHTDIEPTKEWQDEIEVGLRTCDALLALLTPGFHESKWTDQEIGIVLGRDVLIIPAKLGELPYGFIGKFQAITEKEDASFAEEIFILLLKNKKTHRKMANAIMGKFENSGSFNEARNNIELVRKIEYWDEKLVDRLKNSKSNNSQIREAYWVPYIIDSIVEVYEKSKHAV